MDKLALNEVSDLLHSLPRMLEVAQSLTCDPEGQRVGYDLLEFVRQHAAKASENIEGVNYARSAA
ncbi:hypothetical protein KD5_01170 [Yersinia pseudotuberculosis]|uniref:hypothetical protein n=1 Tax=Yersinia pseudotuberculosis complex TaxID=1649845 RepID=UPI0005DC5FEB|nr:MULTISPECIES: hypothetical protein [Yersinia pseudotuberculosis complex]BCU88624.1 hypothetical protein YP72344_01190 [Yersinia pseudotuberculosis]CFV37744.1 Uncharacterised protein [Yersinia pseudotuberculosis]CNF62942.1 Uncharacterised protein [Yersinia similis]CNK91047.1 Uncharacterised protein [Yersinia pseudotuberculosis]